MRPGHPAIRAALGAVARTLGEAIRIEPLIASEYVEASPDPDREPVEALAVVALTPTTEATDGARRGGAMRSATRLGLREATIWLTPQAYGALPYGICSGDRVILKDRDDLAFIVSGQPEASDRGDVAINLVLDGSQ